MAASNGGEDIKFSVVVSMFQWIHKSKSKPLKQSKFRKFLDTFCRKPHDYFAAMRLILPGLDRDRGSYGLKEHVLATCIIDALGISRDSDDAHRLLNWRKAGPRAGLNAGNFSLVAAEVLQRRQGVSSGGLTIKELNDLLDALASSVNRSEKTTVLSDLIRRTNAQEMKWIVMIILKDLKLGISEKSIFHEFHPDAEDLFNVTCDLKLVCEKLRDRNQRHKRQDIEVGKAVRPQLALRVSNAAAAWKKLHGKEVVVECKFDGDRIQIHKNKAEMHFFSRNFFDHQEYAHAMSDIIAQNILVEKCILDGEMLVWDTSANRFAEFGSNQEIAKAAREGLDSDRQVCLVTINACCWQGWSNQSAFSADTSVIHQSLKERHELLRKVVKPIKGSLEILVPNGGLNAHRAPGELCWSVVGHGVDDVEKFFKATVENRDEGIVLKDLNSKWEPGDRSGKWLKLKPEYIRAGSDLDVLIIGGYYGSGRHGGKVAQFLVGISERPSPGTYPRRFISFCRVGTGLSDEELDAVVTRLKPYFRKYEYPKQTPPSFYQVTNSSKERPDVWVESPEKSIIVSITSDIRTIRSEVFAAPYSLRFPRIDRVRYDKPWHECLDVQTFVELVHSSNGTTQRGAYSGRVKDHEPKHIKSKGRERKNALVVPSHFIQTDVSHIKGETSIFLNMLKVEVRLSHSLTIPSSKCISVIPIERLMERSFLAGIKFQAAKLRGDVVNCSWLFDCCSQKRLLPLHPKKSLDQKVLLELAMRRLKLEVSMGGGKVSDDLFHATHLVIISLPEFCVDFDTLLRSFSVSEGRVMCSNKLHVVGSQWLEDCFEKNQKLPEGSYSLKPKNFEASAIKESESDSMIEDHMGKHVIPSSTAKNVGTEKEVALEESTVNMLLPKRDGKRKRRASGRSTSRGKATIIKRPRRTKFGSKPARIDENESSESDASGGIRQNKFGGSDNEENFEFNRWNGENISNHGPEIPVEYVIEDSKPLTEGKEIVQECIDKSSVGGEWNASKTLSQNPLDPVQSILLNMIPSLEKTSSSTVVHENVGQKPSSSSTSMDMGLEQEKPPPPLDLTPNPIKKKKVSYKDAVAALLKD
nr:DNA ligase 4 isoform X1 [Ipomoea batatas]